MAELLVAIHYLPDLDECCQGSSDDSQPPQASACWLFGALLMDISPLLLYTAPNTSASDIAPGEDQCLCHALALDREVVQGGTGFGH